MGTINLAAYKPVAGTDSDAALIDNAFDTIQTVVNGGLDNNNIAAAAGIVASKLADPTTGKVLGSAASACAAVYPPGYELNYTTAAAVNVTDLAENTATALVSPGAITFDGTAVMLEFNCPKVNLPAVLGASLIISLFEGATQIGRLAVLVNPAGQAMQLPVNCRYRFTPTAAAHTYKLTAYVSSTTGTPYIAGAAGGTNTELPMFVRFTKV